MDVSNPLPQVSSPKHVIGIEIGGTKLQMAVGTGRGPAFSTFWRGPIDAKAGGAAIRDSILKNLPSLLDSADLSTCDIAGVGIAFGGPVDTKAGRTLLSNQVEGWIDFPLVAWIREATGFSATIQNDADSAALAEYRFGAGVGFDPMIYVTIGSGIGGGLVLNGQIYRGSGAGALEIGHLRPGQLPRDLPLTGTATVESIGSGFGITERARQAIQATRSTANFMASHRKSVNPTLDCRDSAFLRKGPAEEIFSRHSKLLELARGDENNITTALIAEGARLDDPLCLSLLSDATHCIGWALAQSITLVNPARIVLGGGVSLIGEKLFFEPVRRACHEFLFPPFRGIAEIVPAELGEEVVVHGAIAIAAAEFLDRPGTNLSVSQ